MSDLDPMKTLWTSQKETPMTLSEAEMRGRADKFDGIIRWRNAREYLAAVFVVLFFGYFALAHANPVTQAGAALIVAAAAFVSWRMARTAGPAAADPAATWVERYRTSLVRQRDALRTVWRWYALPFVPGLLLMTAARHLYPEIRLDEPAAWRAMALSWAFLGAVFGGVIWLNHWAARKLQRDLDALDRIDEK